MESEELILKEQAAKRAEKWAGAGNDTFALARKVEKAHLDGEVVPATKENIKTTIRGALKLFLDGNIKNKKIITELQSYGIDMNRLRESVVEMTVSKVLPQIIKKGDIERLTQLADLAGETPEIDIPAGTKRFMRERVIIELDDNEIKS